MLQKLHSCLSKQFKALPSSPVALHFTRILSHSLGSWSQSPPVEQHLCICNPELPPGAVWTAGAIDHCRHAHLWTLALLIWTPAHYLPSWLGFAMSLSPSFSPAHFFQAVSYSSSPHQILPCPTCRMISQPGSSQLNCSVQVGCLKKKNNRKGYKIHAVLIKTNLEENIWGYS